MILLSSFLVVVLFAIYFFVAGMVCQGMSEDLKPKGWWPPIGMLMLSVLWAPVLIWATGGKYYPWMVSSYEWFALTIFKDEM